MFKRRGRGRTASGLGLSLGVGMAARVAQSVAVGAMMAMASPDGSAHEAVAEDGHRIAPQPEPVPTKWEFDFQPAELRVAFIDADGTGDKPYFYLTYKVTNYSGRDRILAPSFTMANDQGGLINSGGVPTAVTRTLLDRLENPFLEDQLGIVDVLLQGADNARFGLVIWPAQDLDVDTVTVFAAGFSGENTVYHTTDPRTGLRERHILRKTRAITYALPGNLASSRGVEPLTVQGAAWVMR